jgi:hypothetical protein
MSRLLSRIATRTTVFYGFFVVTQIVKGVYAARGIEPSPAFDLLYWVACLWVVGWWMRQDSRRRGVGWVFDMGFYLFIAWPLVLPYYLFKTRGARAILAILAFIAVCVAALVLGGVLYILVYS